MTTFTPQKAQQVRCKCGKGAGCFLTGYPWMCLDCFNDKRKELGLTETKGGVTSVIDLMNAGIMLPEHPYYNLVPKMAVYNMECHICRGRIVSDNEHDLLEKYNDHTDIHEDEEATREG